MIAAHVLGVGGVHESDRRWSGARGRIPGDRGLLGEVHQVDARVLCGGDTDPFAVGRVSLRVGRLE